jgi:hypothetical protein
MFEVIDFFMLSFWVLIVIFGLIEAFLLVHFCGPAAAADIA